MAPPNTRVPVVIRLAGSGIAAIDAMAKAEGVSRSEMIRRLLREATAARQNTGKGDAK